MAKKTNSEPYGRVDIMITRILQLGANYAERAHGLNGFAQAMNPFIEKGVRTIANKRTKLPEEFQMLGEMFFGKG